MSKKIDIVLVNVNNQKKIFQDLSKDFSGIEPPLWTGLLAGFLLDKGYSVKIIDAEAEGWGPEETVDKIIEYNPILVGIGAIGGNPSASSTPKMTAVRSVLTLLKNKQQSMKTILYGIHPSALPEKTLREESVDFVCQGESFYPVSQLLEALKKDETKTDYSIKGLWYRKGDEIISNGWADLVSNLDELPFIAWELLPMDKYRAHNWHCFGHIDERSPYAIIYTSLGCPYNCRYCNIHSLYNGKPKIRFRSPQRTVEEIDFLVKTYNVRNFKILDELFVMGGKRVVEICDLLIERNYKLNIWAYARIDTVKEDILKKMKKAGINWIAYGIEAGSKKVRDGVAKGRFSQEKIKEVVKMTHDVGIHIVGNFIFGLPNDNLETMQETLDLAKELNCEYVNFYCAMAYPGSQLYKDAVAQGYPLPKTWNGYAQFSVDTYPLPTKYLTSEQVLAFRDNAFNDYHNDPRYLDMIRQKFDEKTVENIKEMCSFELERKHIDSNA